MALPKPSGDFEWVQESWGTALRCTPLSAIAPHCFSTIELAFGSDGDHARWQALAGALGVGVDRLVRMRQVHGADLYEPRRGSRMPAATIQWPQADIAVTRDPSFALVVKTADCVPILIADSRTGAVAAVHAGWKGTAAGAVITAVEALGAKYGTKSSDLVAAVGPSIGECCYEVGAELTPNFSRHSDAQRWFDTAGVKPRLNLWRATRDQLERAGVPAQRIHVSGLCTAEHPQLFHSYRRDGAHAGRMVAAIRSAPGRTP
jgi:polyphenol oxidase